MALDNANFIAELSITDPPGSDPLSQGDDQIRTIKRATFQSFPLVAAAVNLTDVQMNEMAIKNEQNVFTLLNTFGANVRIDNVAVDRGFQFANSGVINWELLVLNSSGSDMTLRRNVGGVFQDIPWAIANATGIVDFAHPPTVAGAPLWIAGEIRQFAIAASPGTNWFLADGTNGTVNLADRWLVGAGAFAGAVGTNLNASLDALTTANTTGSTAITEAQMPAHNHTVYMTNNGSGGITDQQLNTTDNVFGGRRNDSSKQFSKSNGTRDVIGNAGSGSGHNHSSPAQDVVAQNPTFTGSVQPVSVAVETYQYVP